MASYCIWHTYLFLAAHLSQEVFHTKRLENCYFDNYHYISKTNELFASFTAFYGFLCCAGCWMQRRGSLGDVACMLGYGSPQLLVHVVKSCLKNFALCAYQ